MTNFDKKDTWKCQLIFILLQFKSNRNGTKSEIRSLEQIWWISLKRIFHLPCLEFRIIRITNRTNVHEKCRTLNWWFNSLFFLNECSSCGVFWLINQTSMERCLVVTCGTFTSLTWVRTESLVEFSALYET